MEKIGKKETESFNKWFGPGTIVYFSSSEDEEAWTVRDNCEFKACGGIKKGEGVSPWIIQEARGGDGKILYRDRRIRSLIPGLQVFLLNSQIGRSLAEGISKKPTQQVLKQERLVGF